MGKAQGDSRREDKLYSFQRDIPTDGVEDEASGCTASNRLLTALRASTGTTLVQWSLAEDWSAGDGEMWCLPADTAGGQVTTQHVLEVEDIADATQMLQQFRAAQWELIEELWIRKGLTLPPLADLATDILCNMSTDWDSMRRVQYLGIACGERAATLADLRKESGVEADPLGEAILLQVLAEICGRDLHEGAIAAANSVLLVGRRTRLMTKAEVEEWQATLLEDLTPLKPQAQEPVKAQRTRRPGVQWRRPAF